MQCHSFCTGYYVWKCVSQSRRVECHICIFYQKFQHCVYCLKVTLDAICSDGEVCRLLQMVIERGNITTYEWKTGTKPTSIVDTVLHQNIQDEQTTQQSEEVGGVHSKKYI